MSNKQNVTLLLELATTGDRLAANQLFSLVYDELKRLASCQMKSEQDQLTMQSTALVHEVWLKLVGSQDDPSWEDRRHFFAAASQAMRRILVDAARSRKRLKRGGDRVKFEIRDEELVSGRDEDLLALDDALELLKQEDEQIATLVDLRYFGGFTIAEAAEQLGVSKSTAERKWKYAKAWLRMQLDS